MLYWKKLKVKVHNKGGKMKKYPVKVLGFGDKVEIVLILQCIAP